MAQKIVDYINAQAKSRLNQLNLNSNNEKQRNIALNKEKSVLLSDIMIQEGILIPCLSEEGLISWPTKINFERHYIECGCPFHDHNRKDNFRVDLVTGKMTCMHRKCLSGGNIVQYVMKIRGISNAEAVRYLTNKYISDREVSMQYTHKPVTHSDYIVVRKTQLPELSYELSKDNGFEMPLPVFLTQTKKFPETLLLEAGCREVSGTCIDKKFLYRAVFPVEDHSGRRIGLVGRRYIEKTINGQESNYSKWSSNFESGYILYNLHRVLQRGTSELIIVEGVLDVLRLRQYGYDNAIAMFGNSLSQGQLYLLMNFFQKDTKIILFRDKDLVGYKSNISNLQRLGFTNLWGTECSPEGNAIDASNALDIQLALDSIKEVPQHYNPVDVLIEEISVNYVSDDVNRINTTVKIGREMIKNNGLCKEIKVTDQTHLPIRVKLKDLDSSVAATKDFLSTYSQEQLKNRLEKAKNNLNWFSSEVSPDDGLHDPKTICLTLLVIEVRFWKNCIKKDINGIVEGLNLYNKFLKMLQRNWLDTFNEEVGHFINEAI